MSIFVLRVMVRLGLILLVGASWLALKIGSVFTIVFMFFFGIGLIGLVSVEKFKR